jgi:dienelactone hydrolase
MERAANLPDYNVYRPEDLAATGAPLPVIVWANGGCFRFDGAWESLLTSWARAGFVVVAITTPTGADPGIGGMSTADDQAKAIDWAFAENDRGGSPYVGHLDLSRVVAAGNSCGGITSLTLAAQDQRVRSVFVLSGSSVLPGAPREAAAAIMGNIDVPVGYVVGGPEDIATGPVRQDFDLVPEGVPAYVARRFEGTHVEVSIDADILLEVAEISTNWIDFSLYGNPLVAQSLLENPCASCASGTWTVEAKSLDADRSSPSRRPHTELTLLVP